MENKVNGIVKENCIIRNNNVNEKEIEWEVELIENTFIGKVKYMEK